jgi:hypothetical protein
VGVPPPFRSTSRPADRPFFIVFKKTANVAIGTSNLVYDELIFVLAQRSLQGLSSAIFLIMASSTNNEAIESALARPGYLPDHDSAAYLAQSRDHSTIIAILFVGALVYVIIALRVLARLRLLRYFGLDDWLAVLALVRAALCAVP